jgi:hypothetical protein
MTEKDNSPKPSRKYPPIYEKTIPIILGVIVILIITLLVIIFGVSVGLFS